MEQTDTGGRQRANFFFCFVFHPVIVIGMSLLFFFHFSFPSCVTVVPLICFFFFTSPFRRIILSFCLYFFLLLGLSVVNCRRCLYFRRKLSSFCLLSFFTSPFRRKLSSFCLYFRRIIVIVLSLSFLLRLSVVNSHRSVSISSYNCHRSVSTFFFYFAFPSYNCHRSVAISPCYSGLLFALPPHVPQVRSRNESGLHTEHYLTIQVLEYVNTVTLQGHLKIFLSPTVSALVFSSLL
jgi:hypothetical protein